MKLRDLIIINITDVGEVLKEIERQDPSIVWRTGEKPSFLHPLFYKVSELRISSDWILTFCSDKDFYKKRWKERAKLKEVIWEDYFLKKKSLSEKPSNYYANWEWVIYNNTKYIVELTASEVSELFLKYWGSFVSGLWGLLQRADIENTKKILTTWDSYVKEYIDNFYKK